MRTGSTKILPRVDKSVDRNHRQLKVLDGRASEPIDDFLAALDSSKSGLSAVEANARLRLYGLNEIVVVPPKTLLQRLMENIKNPLVILLSSLALISLTTGDVSASLIMLTMVGLGVSLRFAQELTADKSAAQLKAMVTTKATVIRDGQSQEIDLKFVVPGDLIVLTAGAVVPADVRLLQAKDLFVNQAALTGEALPVEKEAVPSNCATNPLECQNLCFQGTHIENGTAQAIAITTGAATYFGAIASAVTANQAETSFDVGINKLTWLVISLIVIMVPLVFLLNGLIRHNWLEAFMFALAVGVGLTPEMLPMIVTVNLSNGALVMSRKKVIVKHLAAIQNFGAMDILCTDKTGTLTQGKILLEKHIDISGNNSDRVLNYAFLNSYYQTGLRNMMDTAVLEHEDMQSGKSMERSYAKIDEIPFDFARRRMSVVVRDDAGVDWLICKGAIEETFALCSTVEQDGHDVVMDQSHHQSAHLLANGLNSDGFRVLALAVRRMPKHKDIYKVADESNMTLLGLLAFLDPPRETAAQAIKQLNQLGVSVKILTGDNDVVTNKVCRQVGLSVGTIMLGTEIEALSPAELAVAVETTSVFAKLSPANKEQIINALQKNNHIVGFLGDGINDAPALRSADVGISVDSAVDIARESSEIILLEKSLLVLIEGITVGRTVFCNIIKYIKMAVSSNFGNMISVVGASIFLPFLPMLPIQILVNNLLYDFSQTTIPTDNVDAEWLRQPRKWAIANTRNFVFAIGPVSSIFDYATFAVMLYLFNCWTNPALFHTGWFVESLLTQVLIIHVIRTNKIPFLQSTASLPLICTSLTIASVGIWLPYSPAARFLGFVPLPHAYWPIIGCFLLLYVVLTQTVKMFFVRRFGN